MFEVSLGYLGETSSSRKRMGYMCVSDRYKPIKIKHNNPTKKKKLNIMLKEVAK